MSCSKQMRWRSNRRRWKLSGFSGELIKHSMKFAITLTIIPRTCEPLVCCAQKARKRGQRSLKQENCELKIILIWQAERAKEASVYFPYLDSVLFLTVHYATLPFHHSAIPPFHHSAILPFRHSAIPPFCHSAIPSFRHSTIPPFRHSAIPPFRHSAIPLQYTIMQCMYHRRC